MQRKSDLTFFIHRELKQADYFVYKALQKAEIQGIPKIYDVNIHGEWLVVQEEFIQADTLEKMIPCSEKEAAYWMIQLCDILTELHQLHPPIIHRDIKPENIFIRSGELILFDFDIARHYDPAKRHDTTLLGSVGYAAPEQFGFSQTNIQSDIYSCGKLFEVMLTGSLEREYRGKYQTVIQKAKSMDPVQRFQSADQMKNAILGRTLVIPGWNNPTRKGKIGSWIFWILNLLIVFSIDVRKNKSFSQDWLYVLSCFYMLGLLEVVICNRHLTERFHPVLRFWILVIIYFFLLILGISLLMLVDQIMLMA